MQALLWHDFVGSRYFEVSVSDCEEFCASALRISAHDSITSTSKVMIAVNFAMNTSFDLTLADSDIKRPTSEIVEASIVQLTGEVGKRSVLVNGKEGVIGTDGSPQRFTPIKVSSATVSLPPTSVTLILLEANTE